MENFNSLMEQLSALDAAQIGGLRSKLEDKWGMKAITIISVPDVVRSEPAKITSTDFAIFLTAFSNKMGVIKMIREITGFGLMQAKEFVEKDLPKEIKTGLTAEEADEIRHKIEESGGSIEIKLV